MMQPTKQKPRPNAELIPPAAHCQQFTSHHAIFYHSESFTLFPAYLCRKDERKLPGNIQSNEVFVYPQQQQQQQKHTQSM
jgi:hypothetical protein